jgi:ComF family protein
MKRGYNQAALLAREVSKVLNIPINEKRIYRCKPTVPQKELNGKERQNNLKNAFKMRQNDVKLKTIIVVDDIYTTGSTLDAIAKVCKAAGIEYVYSLTVAVGNGL